MVDVEQGAEEDKPRVLQFFHPVFRRGTGEWRMEMYKEIEVKGANND